MGHDIQLEVEKLDAASPATGLAIQCTGIVFNNKTCITKGHRLDKNTQN